MRISEIFYSVQGEGVLTGVPSVFVRTSGCNLRCRWCDTPYASWQPEGPEMSPDEILAEIEKNPTRYVVVTGGEPMIAKGMREFIARLRELGKHVTVETAGTIMPEGCVVDLASLSPKLANSTPSEEKAGAAWVQRHEQTRLQPEVLKAWINESVDYQLKFVISTEADLHEAHDIVKSLGVPVPPEKVLLMPEGTTLEAMRTRYDLLINACKTFGHRLSPRLHIELFGNKRGT
ncbi:7-carboxy-7-deazaguanine synthase QueE [Brevifollis gellanilyticus]|uniref:7-carboxy-7-deazaguanine synthase n=1 Tax=Brevifollis gellanilyticus TaxID=748831 RepID=A0A512MEL7_9BACT|nr:7-carboxy-7-deazaguanine synthase QueE [Brevifollis gellanilyticus]GEP45156.1 7-carboxy-7-deazaguanine synthase [Brevifollis gellanilyticus]